jgi:hypothetical protein
MTIACKSSIVKTNSPIASHKIKLRLIQLIAAHSFRPLGIAWSKSLAFKIRVQPIHILSGTHRTWEWLENHLLNARNIMSSWYFTFTFELWY